MNADTPVVLPLAVTARNEEKALPACLASLATAVALAQPWLQARGLALELLVVLDTCTDRSAQLVAERGLPLLVSQGGLVEAQRRVVEAYPAAPFVIFSDADVTVTPPTLLALVEAMCDDPNLRVAYPSKQPLPPARPWPLAWALYVYNRDNGYQTRRLYFSGKLFAIRGWQVPTRAELAGRIAQLPPDRFYDYQAGMRVDDIYLSRRILAEAGPAGIREVAAGLLWFRPPATWRGMYRTYRRMRMEIERLDVLFPESREVHRRWGIRGRDEAAWRAAAWQDRAACRYFAAALLLCRGYYHLERLFYQHFAGRSCDPWRPIAETKSLLPGG